jgi:ribosomal peptide maturation radical SAM protein 1
VKSAAVDHVDVALVSLPWAPPHEPSLAISILAARLREAGITARSFHFAPMLLRWVQTDTYQFLAECWGINEFLFSGELDTDLDETQLDRLSERLSHYSTGGRHSRYSSTESLLELVLRMREVVVPAFLGECEEAIRRSGCKLAGFTCMFDQTIPSLALGRRLRRQDDDLLIALGGYALEGPPGQTVASAFPWVDWIVLGDGEDAILDLAGQIGTGQAPHREERGPRFMKTKKIDMADSPVPDYGDWFDDVEALRSDHQVDIATRVLPVEASRGCWWGQVKHCVFCGIDDEALQYRQKDPATVLSMLNDLRERHGDRVFRFSDYIMPKSYYRDLLPTLALQQPKFRLHSEIKANQPPERVRLLSEAGFREVQPGIESFSTAVLKRMDKGVRSIDNVSLLKAGYVNSIVIDYNILYGLPGDETADYDEMLALLPRLYHLTPPVSRNETVVTRFAPLQTDPGLFGIATKAVHHVSYDVLWSQHFMEQTGFSLDSYAYYFDRNFDYSPELQALYRQLSFQVDHWKAQHREGFVELSYETDGRGRSVIRDSRSDPTEYELNETMTLVYLSADGRFINKREVIERCGRRGVSRVECEDAIAGLDQLGLIWVESDLLLGLAVDRRISAGHEESRWSRSWTTLFV